MLIDTHILIWWDDDRSKLSVTALSVCDDPANELVLSIASIWEMQIKQQTGKLSLRLPLSQLIAEQQLNGVEVLPVSQAHIFALAGLPPYHRDPFDRMLIAQAISEGVSLVSADPVFRQYPVNLIS